MLPTIEFNKFEVWRCLRPYPELDRLIADNPQGFVIKKSRRKPVLCLPQQLDGNVIRYGDYCLILESDNLAKYLCLKGTD